MGGGCMKTAIYTHQISHSTPTAHTKRQSRDKTIIRVLIINQSVHDIETSVLQETLVGDVTLGFARDGWFDEV